jgi:hypothetical protein
MINKTMEKEAIKEFLKIIMENILESKSDITYEIEVSKIEDFFKKYFPKLKYKDVYHAVYDFIKKYYEIFRIYGIDYGSIRGQILYNGKFIVLVNDNGFNILADDDSK